MIDPEAQTVDLGNQADNRIGGWDLLGLAARLADEEGEGDITRPAIKREIRVQAFNAGHKSEGNQEIERAIGGWRRHGANPVQRRQDFISGQWALCIKQDIQHMLTDRGQAFAIQLRLICGGLQQFLAAWLRAIRAAPAAAVQAAFSSRGCAGSHACHSMTYMPDTRLRRVKILSVDANVALDEGEKET